MASYSDSSQAGNGDAAAEQDQSATTQAQADKSPAAGQQVCTCHVLWPVQG